MLKSLEIQNFKGIKQGKLDDLAQVNILVGRNNSGKSTILDALIMLRCGVVPLDRFGTKGLDQIIKRRVDRGSINYDEFWFMLNNHLPLFFEARFDNSNYLTEEWHSDPGGNAPTGKMVAHEVEVLSSGEAIPSREFNINPSMNFSARNYQDYGVWQDLSGYLGQKYADYVALIHFLDANAIHAPFGERLWPELVKDRRDDKIRQMLNEIYGTAIEYLAFMPFPKEQRLVAALPNVALAVDGFGDGFRYALNILSLGVFLKGTALLVEELETHQHPESLRKLIQTLFELAREQDLQLFLTTHSMELITYALDAAEEKGIDLKLHHLILHPEGNLTSIPMSQPNAKVLLDIGHDPRLHYKYVNEE